KEHWNSIEGCRHSRIFITDLDNSKAKYLRGLNRNKLAWTTGFITGHCALKSNLYRMGLINNPICTICLEGDETVSHLLCDCPALARQRASIFGNHFPKIEELSKASVSSLVKFIMSNRLLN
ncbi:hypothetical protein C0J52_05438, partial [Blattella germanica]